MLNRWEEAAAHRDRLSDEEWIARLRDLDIDDLRRLAASLPVIEQAKGVLMAHYACDAPAAFAVLTRWSMTRNVKLRLIAADVVAAAARGSSPRHGSLPEVLASLDAGTATHEPWDGYGDNRPI